MPEYLKNLIPFEPLEDGDFPAVWSQPIGSLEILGKLGKGGFGDVWAVKRDDMEGEFAAKEFKAHIPDNTKEAVINEARLTRKLRHKHVLKCYGIYKRGDSFVIIYEVARGGTLLVRERTNSKEHKSFSEEDAAHIVRQMAEALEYIHGKKVMHRDVKPENIFFKNFPSSSLSKDAILLGDFGFAYESKDNKASKKMGSPSYVAPEVIRGAEYTEKVDIWALGAITYELLSGVMLFSGDDDNKTLEQVMRKQIVFPGKIWQGISHDARDFVSDCLDRDATKRMSAEEAFRHKWLRHHTDISTARNFNALDAWKKGISEVKKENRDKKEIKPEKKVQVPGEQEGGGPVTRASRKRKSLESTVRPAKRETHELSVVHTESPKIVKGKGKGKERDSKKRS